jgi:hypothetical protein
LNASTRLGLSFVSATRIFGGGWVDLTLVSSLANEESFSLFLPAMAQRNVGQFFWT